MKLLYAVLTLFILNITLCFSFKGDIGLFHETLSLMKRDLPDVLQDQDAQLDHNSGIGKTSQNISESCRAFLNEFSKHVAKFVKCSIDNSRPFRLCVSCVDAYKRAIQVFDDIKDDNHPDGGCKSVLLESDRVQVVNQVKKNIMTIWNDAVCDKCFSSVVEDNNGTVKHTLSEDTVTFFSLYYNTSYCIHSHMNTTSTTDDKPNYINKTVCEDCRPYYRALNKHFVKMQTDSGFKVCMDLVDVMNYTRLMWGDTLHCTGNYRDDMKMLTIGLLMPLAPVSFYVFGKLCGGRKEIKFMRQKRMSKRVREHHYGSFTEISDNEDGLDNSSTEPAPVVFRGNKIILPTD